MGPVYQMLAEHYGYTFDQIGALSWPQVECLVYRGKPPGRRGGGGGRKVFRGPGAAKKAAEYRASRAGRRRDGGDAHRPHDEG